LKRQIKDFLNNVGLKTHVDVVKIFDKVTSPRKTTTKKPKDDPYSFWEDIFRHVGYSLQEIKFRMKSTNTEA